MENELKPCVRCESIDTGELSENVPGWFCVVCSLTKGGCGMSTALHEDKQEPVDDWNNTRPNQEDLAEAVDKWLKKAKECREEANKIRRTVKTATGAEERCNVRSEIYTKCANDIQSFLSKRQGGS